MSLFLFSCNKKVKFAACKSKKETVKTVFVGSRSFVSSLLLSSLTSQVNIPFFFSFFFFFFFFFFFLFWLITLDACGFSQPLTVDFENMKPSQSLTVDFEG